MKKQDLAILAIVQELRGISKALSSAKLKDLAPICLELRRVINDTWKYWQHLLPMSNEVKHTMTVLGSSSSPLFFLEKQVSIRISLNKTWCYSLSDKLTTSIIDLLVKDSVDATKKDIDTLIHHLNTPKYE